MRYRLVLTLLILSSIGCFGFDKQALQDSITRYANERAHVGKITLTRIKQNGNCVAVEAHNRLAYVSFTPQEVEHIYQLIGETITGETGAQVSIKTDGYELSELIATRYRDERPTPYRLKEEKKPLTQNTSLLYSAPKGLQDIHIALYGSHGQFYHQTNDRWMFQRAKVLTTVEDLFTSSYTMPFLVPMLENAGAIVLQPRERDTQTEEIIVDDKAATKDDSWKEEATNGWGEFQIPLTDRINPFNIGGYIYSEQVANKHEASIVTYPINATVDGDYAVYISYKTLGNSTDQARYKVVHSGIETEYKINQQMGGGTWIYLGTFHFCKSDPKNNYISVSNYGKDTDKIVTTDAIRIGGGMGSVARQHWRCNNSQEAHISTIPRYMEGARYWLQYAGFPDSVYIHIDGKNDYKDDLVSRGRWINYLSGKSETNNKSKSGLGIPIHLGLAFHSDAGVKRNDSIIGTLAIYTAYNDDKETVYPTADSHTRLLARDYADYVQSQIVNDMRTLLAPEWSRRELKNSSYAETRYPEIPTIILELLSHQNIADMRYGLDPRVRFIASRAVYKGILRFMHEQYGTDYIVQPLPVCDFAITSENGNNVRLSWNARIDTIEQTATPEYYIVYRREGNQDWDNGTKVNKTTFCTELKHNTPTDFKVVAVNDGGQSFPSEILSAGIGNKQKILIINGFTRVAAPESFRIDSTNAGFRPDSYAVPYGKDISYIGSQYEFSYAAPYISDDNAGFGASYADYATKQIQGNSFDYPAQHGRALLKEGYSYISSSASAITTIPSDAKAVVLVLGKQKTTIRGTEMHTSDYKVIPQNLQTALRNYLAQGGKAMISGAYIASDMRETYEKKFLKDVLHIKYASYRATHSGEILTQKPFSIGNMQLTITPSEEQICTEDPDGIVAQGDNAQLIARYADSGVGAGVTNGKQLIVWAFPIESCAKTDTILVQSINYLLN